MTKKFAPVPVDRLSEKCPSYVELLRARHPRETAVQFDEPGTTLAVSGKLGEGPDVNWTTFTNELRKAEDAAKAIKK